MGLLSKLFGKDDPTAGWPAATGKPALDPEHHAVGPLRLGDPLEKARALGRPERVTGQLAQGTFLEYADFDLEFSKGQLVCATFNVDPGKSVAVAGFTLTPTTTPLDVQAWLGEPSSDGREGKFRWIDFERGEATLALEYTEGKLTCVQLYGKDYA